MARIPSVQLPGLPKSSYYAPNFKVEVEGRELDPQAKGDVLEVRVTMDLKELTGFELNVNNWDDQTMFFKYSDTETFDVGNRVVIHMGYADDLRVMAAGPITALSPKFPESGSPTVGVTGVDSMVKLREKKPTADQQKRFDDMADWEIAQVIARRNNLDAQVDQVGEKHPVVLQKDQDEAHFLLERAARIDFDCFIRMDPVTLRETLHFVRPRDGRHGAPVRVYVFEWGKTLISFSPKISLRKQVSQVTVRGWDPMNKQPITYTATPEADLPQEQGGGDGGGGSGGGSGASGPEAARERMNNREEIVVDQPVLSMQEARDLAMSLLRERAYDYLTGTGQVIGLPDLRPADNVELRGLGRRFSGTYYVTKVVHTLGSSGFTTQFDVRKIADGGVVPDDSSPFEQEGVEA